MVNYHDPATIAQEFAVAAKLWHVVNGIFIWEFFATLDYEWDVIRGHRPYRWTIWVYSIARVSALLSVILNMVGMDNTAPINCQVWIILEAFFSYLAFSTSSLLIVLRIIAIWNRAKIIMVIAMGMWVTEATLFIHAIVRLRSARSPEANACILLNVTSAKPAIIGVLVTDVVLLVTMLIGLLRMRINVGSTFGLARILWNQGLIWLLLATVAEVPPATLMILNLNETLDLMPQMPSMIVVTIAATRIYRSLINFASSDISHENPKGSECPVSEMRVRSGPITFNRKEVSVLTECDRYPSLKTSCGSISTETQGRDEAHEVSLNLDVESGPEK